MEQNNDLTTILSFEEARSILKVTKPQLRKLFSSGELKGFKIGKYNWRITKKALLEYLEQHS